MRNLVFVVLAREFISLQMKISLPRLSSAEDKLFRKSGYFTSLYLHVPFCKNICDYCALYSVVENGLDVREAYLAQVESTLQAVGADLSAMRSIFVGGGTPTQLREDELERFLQVVKQNTDCIDRDFEFSVECNPATVNLAKFEIMKKYGVNRLSFGAQSTTRKTRNTLGRRTSKEQLNGAIEMARECGFSNINIDLIYGVPGQSLEDWQEDLTSALAMDLPHYSAYSLILEEGTVLADRYDSVDDEQAVRMYDMAGELMSEAGLERYEISNYSRPGMQCKHNYDIWKGGTYLGVGPAASSFDGRQRWTQVRDLKKWLSGEGAELDELSEKERLAEVLAFGFRTVEGWKISELESLYGVNVLELFEDLLTQLKNDDLIEEKQGNLKATEKGLLFADTIAEFLIF